MRAVVVGTGAVGARAARQLHSTTDLDDLVVCDLDEKRAGQVADSLGDPARAQPWAAGLLEGADVVVLAQPGPHRPLAELALEHGAHVVSVSESLDDVRALLELDAEARERRLSVVVGAGFSPGLSCLLARHVSSEFTSVEEVHVAKVGTGGRACARQHHEALAADAVDWRDGAWARRPGGSGRELCWFPDPLGGLDCYRAALPEALLLEPAFAGARRITARVAATRRDRLTAHLPMLRRPHIEGTIGAIRVEVRGRRGLSYEVRVLGAVDRPAVACGTVAAVGAVQAVEGRFTRVGAGGLAELVGETTPVLHELARRGVRAAAFEGAGTAAATA